MGINFYDYLTNVLNRTTTMPPEFSADAYRNLIPDRWTKE